LSVEVDRPFACGYKEDLPLGVKHGSYPSSKRASVQRFFAGSGVRPEWANYRQGTHWGDHDGKWRLGSDL